MSIGDGLYGGLLNGLGGGLQQQQQYLNNAMNNAWMHTTTGCETYTYGLGIQAAPMTPFAVAAKDPDEIAWLKRRVKEIEWRA